MLGYEVKKMIAEEKSYDYYPETLAKIMLAHNLITPNEKEELTNYIRGF
jgi:hypothetical protein|tara:strand:- start:411 stop:557 length:147 start_codon:yes stop_codon:yes gene_type:complete